MLKGKTVVVTGGGGSGIGHGITAEMMRAGARTIVFELDVEAGRATGAETLAVDISKEDEVRDAFASIGPVDALVNNAGIGLIRPVAEASTEEFDKLMSVDMRGLWLCSKYSLKQMIPRKKGVIINISSVHATATLPMFGIYAGAKAGVRGLTRGIAVQYGPDGIRAVSISPGLVDGDQTRRIVEELSPDVQGWLDSFVRRHQAMPVLIQPEDIGKLAVFLASDWAASITGIDIPCDAGMLAMLTSRD